MLPHVYIDIGRLTDTQSQTYTPPTVTHTDTRHTETHKQAHVNTSAGT